MSKKSPLVRDSMTILVDRYDAVELPSDQGGMGVPIVSSKRSMCHAP